MNYFLLLTLRTFIIECRKAADYVKSWEFTFKPLIGLTTVRQRCLFFDKA